MDSTFACDEALGFKWMLHTKKKSKEIETIKSAKISMRFFYNVTKLSWHCFSCYHWRPWNQIQHDTGFLLPVAYWYLFWMPIEAQNETCFCRHHMPFLCLEFKNGFEPPNHKSKSQTFLKLQILTPRLLWGTYDLLRLTHATQPRVFFSNLYLMFGLLRKLWGK